MDNEEHPVVRGLRWILENRTKPNGKPMSMRALSLSAKRTGSQVEQILSGRQSADLSLDLAHDLARAGDVRVTWLLTHRGDPGRYEGAERTELERNADILPLIEKVAEELPINDAQRRELLGVNWSIGTSFGTIWNSARDIIARDNKRSTDRAIADERKAPTILDLAAEIERQHD